MTPYFAYGSNMNRALMAHHCPGAVAGGPATLKGWRFVIMRQGYASIVPDPRAEVPGVLWQLSLRDIAALNIYENVDGGLYRQRYVAALHKARRVRALVYVAASRVAGLPRPGYLDLVISGAREWNLPETYLATLRRA